MYLKTRRLLSFGWIFLLPFIYFPYGCKGQSEEQAQKKNPKDTTVEYVKWLVDYENLDRGCDRPDCIRSIDRPNFTSVDSVEYIGEDDLVIGMRMGDAVRCYPHAILNWHEIVNDSMQGKDYAVTYCPLTGSGMAWDRSVQGKTTTFGISGMLYNSNVIPYDRSTRSSWSQMKQLCVNGELMGQTPEVYPVIETSWDTWKKLYPGSRVISAATGMKRDYKTYPYETYREDEDIYFPVAHENDSLPAKTRMFGILINGKAKCYTFHDFGKGVTLVNDTAFGKHILLAGSNTYNFITAFENPEERVFRPVKDKLPGIFSDADGNLYDLFGYCISGSRTGEHLEGVNAFMAYWFAWVAFYPDLTFYKK